MNRKHSLRLTYFIALKRSDNANETADEISHRLRESVHPRGIKNFWTIRRKMHLEKKTVSLEEKFSQLNFTIRSQLDKSINLTDPTMKNRVDRRFEKGLRNSSRTSHARASTTCIRCQVSATFAESNRIPARVSSRAPNSGRKTEGEEEKEEEEASPGNKRRDKWRIDATVIYVDPLPPHPSLEEGTSWPCWGRVDTSLSDTYC